MMCRNSKNKSKLNNKLSKTSEVEATAKHPTTVIMIKSNKIRPLLIRVL